MLQNDYIYGRIRGNNWNNSIEISNDYLNTFTARTSV